MSEILWWWGDSTGVSNAKLCVRTDTAGVVSTSAGGSVELDPAANYGIGSIVLDGVSHGQPISIYLDGALMDTGAIVTMPADGENFNIAFFSCFHPDADPLVCYQLVRDHNVRFALFSGDDPYVDAGFTAKHWFQSVIPGAYAADPLGAGGRAAYDASHANFRRQPGVAEIMHNAICYCITQDHMTGNDWTHDYLLAKTTRSGLTTQVEADAVFNNSFESWRAWWGVGNPANADSEVAAWKPSSADAATPSSNYPASYWRKRIGSVELFGIDCITYRCSESKLDAGALIETDAGAKTQLGRPQKAWLKSRTAASVADYIVIVGGEGTHIGNKTSDNCDWGSQYVSERDDLISYFAGLPQGVGWSGGDTHTPFVINTSNHFCINACPAGQAEQSGSGTVGLGDGYVDGFIYKPRGNPGWTVEPQPRAAGLIRVSSSGLVWQIVSDYGQPLFSGTQLPGAKSLAVA